MVVDIALYTLKDIRVAYDDAYYEGAGDDAWYRDHSSESSEPLAEAMVQHPMKEHIKWLEKQPRRVSLPRDIVANLAWRSREALRAFNSYDGGDESVESELWGKRIEALNAYNASKKILEGEDGHDNRRADW